MGSHKTVATVRRLAGPEREIAWYADASSDAIATVIRAVFELEASQRFALIDDDGHAVALSSGIPSGLVFTLMLTDGCSDKARAAPRSKENQDPNQGELEAVRDFKRRKANTPPRVPILLATDPNSFVIVPTGVSTFKRPSPRWGACAASLSNGTVIVHGGLDEKKTFGDVHVYSLIDSEWTSTGCDSGMKTIARAWGTMTYLPRNGAILVFGGEDEHAQAIAQPMLLDVEIMLWYAPTIIGSSPRPRAGHTASLVGDQLVVFAGSNRRRWSADVYVVHTLRWAWSKPRVSGEIPSARSFHTASVVDHNIVVFGGNNGDETLNDVCVLDTLTWKWSYPVVVGDVPSPRTGHSAAVVDDHRIVVFGGWDYSDQECVKYFSDSFILDTRLWEWTKIDPCGLNLGCRVGQAVVTLQGTSNTAQETVKGANLVALFGGQDRHEKFHDDIWLYSPPSLAKYMN